jgi:hypothetical protein
VHVGLFGPNTVKVIVPVGLKPPDSTALSLTVPPAAVPDAEAVVTINGAADANVTASPGAPQAEEAAALFASPEYETSKLYWPAPAVGNGPELYVPFPVTVTVEVCAAVGVPVHVGLFGPNTVNVIVPVGLAPPDSTPESLTVPPAAVPEAEAVVAIAGVAGASVTASPGAPHADTTAALFASPE